MAFKYRLIESTLIPEADVDWLQLAQRSASYQMFKQSLYYYTKHINICPDSLVTLHAHPLNIHCNACRDV